MGLHSQNSEEWPSSNSYRMLTPGGPLPPLQAWQLASAGHNRDVMPNSRNTSQCSHCMASKARSDNRTSHVSCKCANLRQQLPQLDRPADPAHCLFRRTTTYSWLTSSRYSCECACSAAGSSQSWQCIDVHNGFRLTSGGVQPYSKELPLGRATRQW